MARGWSAVAESYGPWEPTPRWHPAYWFGFDVRRYQNHEPYDRGWEYGRSQKVARALLDKRYGEKKHDGPPSALIFD